MQRGSFLGTHASSVRNSADNSFMLTYTGEHLCTENYHMYLYVYLSLI